MNALTLLLLIIVANGAPILGSWLFGSRWNWPVDAGLCASDGRRLLGEAKTWRGLLLALGASALIAPALGVDADIGLLIGGTAMLGDLVSSFAKRRLGLPSSSRCLGLDQVPESLLPALASAERLGIDLVELVGVVLAFFVLELTLSRLLYRWHIRARPY